MMCAVHGASAQDNKLEAEDANYSNCKLIDDNKYSGGKALELTDGNAKITFTYEATEKGKYDISVGYDGLYGQKQVNISVNGSNSSFPVDGQEEKVVGTYFINQGSNTIVITPNWTWFRIDYIRIEPATNTLPFDIAQTPVDPQATESAKKLYSLLYRNFGKKTISGIMTGDMASANGNVTQHDDMKAVYQASGKYPALVGFDFMNTTGMSSQTDWNESYSNAMMSLAKDTWRRGGIPAFTWHWRDPSLKTGEFYSEKSSVKVSDAMNTDGTWNTSSTLYNNFIKDIDKIADCLIELQNEGIACIFRPLHEASGRWFWWGREGAEPCVKLFRLLIDEMQAKGVHNVIWVWNAGDYDTEWNPGENYYDIISADIYNKDYDYSSNYSTFDNLKTLSGGKKLIALSENGPIPDIDRMADEEAMWSWWMPWYQTWNGKFVDKTSREEWTKCMTDERVITLEDLSAGWNSQTVIALPKANWAESRAVFDLAGYRIPQAPSRGVYIKGGRKYAAH